jgi:hypothetical protein
MIKEGDRVLVGLSGGKDSLSMLHILMMLRKFCLSAYTCICECMCDCLYANGLCLCYMRFAFAL